MERIRRFFKETNLTWKRLIVFAIIVGIYTGVMALLPFTKDTSFEDISISFECWVLFGIFIILNSKSPLDSGLKCFIFFLISQPLAYLVQVPFYDGGWSIFGYYKPWFLWTLLAFPMGFIGHYLKRDKWWGLLILTPMLLLVGVHYADFLNRIIAYFPRHLLSMIFCAATVLLYPAVAFENRKLKCTGVVIAVAILAGATVFAVISNHEFYTTDILVSGESEEEYFDDSYTVYLEDDSYGEVTIVHDVEQDIYKIHAEFKKPGTTELILISPEGNETVYALTIEKDTFGLDPLDPVK